MTLIIFIKCADASILLLDRKESNASGVGQTTQKYYLPTNREFVLALAGESIRIDTIVSDLHIDQTVTNETIRKKLYDIIENSPQFGNAESISDGLLLIKDESSFEFNNVWFTNSRQSIVKDDPSFKCYGEGFILADYLIRKFNFSSLSQESACRCLLAILQDISKRVDSVGSIDNYGVDLLVFTNSGELKQTRIDNSDGINNIDCNWNVEDDFSLSFSSSKISSKLKVNKDIKKLTIKGVKSIQTVDNNYSVSYRINGGEIYSITPNEDANSLIISLVAINDGELTITLPRTLLDSKADNIDDEFIVLCDGTDVLVRETPTTIDKTLTISFKKDCKEIEIIGTILYEKSIETASFETSKDEFDTKKIHDMAIKRKSSIVIQTDQNIYSYGSNMIITISNPYFIPGESIILEIKNENKKIIYRNSIPVSKDAKSIYQKIIRIEGKDWSIPGSRYKIKATYLDKIDELEITTSNFGATIELDQKIYSWRDKIFITIVAPDLARDPESVEEIGQTNDSTIIISTSRGQLNKYKLVETGKDTGIFAGEIQLSGFLTDEIFKNKLDTLTSGKTLGSGPTDGKIACANEDEITVNLITPSITVNASAMIRWNIGEISWLESTFPASGTGVIRVVDPDVSLESEQANEFEIKVWSDTDPEGIKIMVVETNNNTGIFNGTVFFTAGELSKTPVLRVSEGDTVTAEYLDKTLPAPYSLDSELIITGTSMIGTMSPPLERIQLSNSGIVDQSDIFLSEINSDDEFEIGADLTNIQKNSQKYVFIVKITNDSGVPISFTWVEGELSSNQKYRPTLPWKPRASGMYTVTIFVWETLHNQIALSLPTKFDVIVNEKISEHNDMTLDVTNKEIQQRFPLKPVVSIPIGASTPGCEKHHKCFIPHEMIIRVNQTVVWNNDDSTNHTITSGIPNSGPDGNFDAGLIISGNSFAHKFTKKGIYPYFCLLHPWQEGIIVVE